MLGGLRVRVFLILGSEDSKPFEPFARPQSFKAESVCEEKQANRQVSKFAWFKNRNVYIR